MQREIIVKGRSLGGCSDLTLFAPLKPGFIESLESVTYKTCTKRVLEMLHGARETAHEYQTARLLSDSIERVGVIHSVRVAVLEPENKVLLAASFDGSWESYIRVLWEKVGTLLDLIFCGTIDYVTAYDHSFDEWLAWARRVQIETGFFYGPPDATARDVLYQRRVERMRLAGSATSLREADLDDMRAVLPSAESALQRLVNPPNPLQPDDPQICPVDPARMVRERIRNGMLGLAALYRLTDLHRPGTSDGNVLREAALDLLAEFVGMRNFGLIDKELKDQRDRFARELDWLFPDPDAAALGTPHKVPPPAADNPRPLKDVALQDVQGGILETYDDISHGMVLMLAFDDAAGVKSLLDWLDGKLTTADDSHLAVPGRVLRNLGFTLSGLRAGGIDEDTLELFPEEFRQGMAARAGLLGDVRNNHPMRWRLPRRFVAVDVPPGPQCVDLEGVHAVLQLRCCSTAAVCELFEPGHPLRAEVQALLDQTRGVRVLAAQSMRRNFVMVDGAPTPADHFDYADGDGQPEVEPKPDQQPFKRNRIHLGELLLGHENAADFPVDLGDPQAPEADKTRRRWLQDGSFLVVRKYRQFASRLEAAVASTVKAMEKELGQAVPPVDYAEIVYARLMGRNRNGTPLIPVVPGQPNLFTYDRDRDGQQCPLHAHIRLAHPRLPPGETTRPPRIMRRGMAYGPERRPGNEDAERGLMFMAYNADLGEQFEVVQRWLAGGNSTGSSSGQSCPIVGVPENGLPRHYRFEYPGPDGEMHVFRVELETDSTLFEEPPVITQLEWGLYLFAPSVSVLQRLRALAASMGVAPLANVPWEVVRGREKIAGLLQIEAKHGADTALAAWKEAIEDPEAIDRDDASSLWAAIRNDHGGVLKTPYGVLVASRERILEVFGDRSGRYSICGQLDRMKRSFGEIFLGMDEGPVYRQLSGEVNAACMALRADDTFTLTRNAALAKIDAIVAAARRQSMDVNDARFQVAFDAREVLDDVLAEMCDAWFGLADEADPSRPCFRRGSADWAWTRDQPPLYPGHFTALSRYMFQPNPGETVAELGEAYGHSLRDAMQRFVADHRARGPGNQIPTDHDGQPAPIAQAIFNHSTHGADDDFVARTMVGVMMGFIAPVIGAVLNVLSELQRSDSFGALRTQLARAQNFSTASRLLAGPVMAATCMRPMPQIVWRTALETHRLGPADGIGAVEVRAGDKLVLGLVSGTQQSLEDRCPDDARLMFGGVRDDSDTCPTHACPGYHAGFGAILGTLTALLTWADANRPPVTTPAWPTAIRPGSAPFSFLLEGSTLPKAETEKAALAFRMASAALKAEQAAAVQPTKAPPTRGFVLAWGDSWLDRTSGNIVLGTDLRDCLENAGYFAPEDFCKYPVWLKAKYLADNPQAFCGYLDAALLAPDKPLAILISAGGNDSTGDTLQNLLNDKGTLPVLKQKETDQHIEALRTSYGTIIKAIRQVLDDHAVKDIPIIVHGYDHPIPRARSAPFLGDYARKWMYAPFKAHGYLCDEGSADLQTGTAAMRELIDRLNSMLSGLATGEFQGMVRYVDLRGTVPEIDGELRWVDDLHPNDAAFKVLAAKIAAEIPTIRKA